MKEGGDERVRFTQIGNGRTRKAGGMGDRGKMENKIGGSTEGRMKNHGIAKRSLREDLAHRMLETHRCPTTTGC